MEPNWATRSTLLVCWTFRFALSNGKEISPNKMKDRRVPNVLLLTTFLYFATGK